MKLTTEGVCPCGGILQTAEWTTKQEKKGRSTCKACGRTELKTEKKMCRMGFFLQRLDYR